MNGKIKEESAIFKERLHKTLKVIWYDLLLPFTAFIIIISLVVLMGIYVPNLYNIAVWGACILVSLIALIGLSIFIYWLFIEPFLKNKEENH